MRKIFNFQSSIFYRQNGFTLIETTVAIFGFAIIMLGLVSLFSGVFVDSSRQSTVLADTDQARKAVFGLINELRNAQSGSNGAYSLEKADNQEIVFFANLDSDANIERARYSVQGDKLMKGITKYNGSAYNPASETAFVAQNNLAAQGGVPIFFYYNDSYTGSTTQPSLTQPVNVTEVKFIKVSLPIANKAGSSGGGVFTVTASGAVRNLKTNLGN